MFRSALRRTTLRQRLVIIFLIYTLVIMLLVGGVWGSQFEIRAVELTRELLSSGVQNALNAGQQTISAETAVAASDGDPTALTTISGQLDALGSMAGRTSISADLYAELPGGGYRWLAGDSAPGQDIAAEVQLPPDETTIEHTQRIARGHGCVLLSTEAPRTTLCVTADASWVFGGRDTIVQTLVIIGLAALPVIVGIAYAISRGITTPVYRLVDAAEKLGRGEPYDPAPLRVVEEYGAELSVLARVFSRMAADIQAREAELKSQLESLVIRIDSAKKDAYVSEITDTDFFRELQRKKQQLRSGTPSANTATPNPALDSSPATEHESMHAPDIDTEAGAGL